MEAAKRFDTSRNIKFSTYGSFWIRRYLTNYIKKLYIKKETVEYTDTLHNYINNSNNNNNNNNNNIIDNFFYIN